MKSLTTSAWLKPKNMVMDHYRAGLGMHGGIGGNLVFIESTMKKEDYLRILQQNITSSVEKLVLGETKYFNRILILSIPSQL